MPEMKLGLTANRTVFNTCIVLLTTHAVRTKLTYWLNYWLADLISVFISVERGNCGSSTANEVQTETHDRHPVFSFNWFWRFVMQWWTIFSLLCFYNISRHTGITWYLYNAREDCPSVLYMFFYPASVYVFHILFLMQTFTDWYWELIN